MVMAAVMAEGTTTIYNAACEPYLQQLCKIINSMGGNITGVGQPADHRRCYFSWRGDAQMLAGYD